MRTLSRVGAGLALLLLFAPVATAAATGEAGKKSVLSPDLVNSIVTVVVFGALLAVLYRFAWGPIRQGLQLREDAQFQALEEARKAREEATALRTQVQADLAKAQDELRAEYDRARKDAEKLRLQEREAGVRDAQAERDRAKAEIAAAKDAALREIYDQTVGLASAVAAKALGREITGDDHRRLLDESLAELGQAGKPVA